MVAFAANSLLCRLALGGGLIDAASFSTVRMVSGAAVLLMIVLPKWRSSGLPSIDWRAPAVLFIYMIFFSFAYLSLSTGTGALLLFGSVQLTMFVVALHRGAQLPPLSWVGLALAVFGLVFLLLPGITAPDPTGAVLMTVAGIAWGAYSLLGKRAACVLDATVVSFALAVPLMLIVSLVFRDDFYATRNGVFLAVASGAMASGIGYVIWYAALRGLAETSAATVQLSVPVIAAVGGVILLSEQITLRLLLASVVIIGGITVVLLQRTAGVPGQRVELNNELK